MIETQDGEPHVSINHSESWWWVKPTRPGKPTSSVSARREIVLRAQRIFGGTVEVYRTVTSSTTIIYEVTQ